MTTGMIKMCSHVKLLRDCNITEHNVQVVLKLARPRKSSVGLIMKLFP